MRYLFLAVLLVFSVVPAFADDPSTSPDLPATSVISSSLSGAIQHAIGNPLASTQTVTPAIEEVVPVTTTTTSMTTESFPYTSIVPVTTTTQIQTGTVAVQQFMHDPSFFIPFQSTLPTMTTSQFQSIIPYNYQYLGLVRLDNQYFMTNLLSNPICATACLPANSLTIPTPTGLPVGSLDGKTVYSYDLKISGRESVQVIYHPLTNSFTPAPADHDYTGKTVTFYSPTSASLSSQEYASYQAGYKNYSGKQEVTTGKPYFVITSVATPTGTIQAPGVDYATGQAWGAKSVITNVPTYSTTTSTSFKPVTTTSTVTVPVTTSSSTFKTVYIPLKSSAIHLSASTFTTVGPPISTKITSIKGSPVVAPLTTRWNSLPGPGSPTLLQISPWSNPISLVASLAIGAVLPGHSKSVWFGQIAKNHPFMGGKSLRAPTPIHVSHHPKTSIHHI
jgi:hypothetical protein